ncbi:MAG: hypothetical protein M0P31_17005 [Solirubrobacteraceae bacterium]|nr:hypothetical protein [Solirubrobacteraceae bacterium]
MGEHSTEVVSPAQAVEVVNPLTGELVDVAALPTDALAVERNEIRAARDAISAWARAIDGELTARLDREARRSATVAGYKLSVTAPEVWSTDALGLRNALAALVADGVLSQAAVDAAVEPVTKVEARRRGLTALHNHADERVKSTVAEYDRRVENPTRRVTVTEVVS